MTHYDYWAEQEAMIGEELARRKKIKDLETHQKTQEVNSEENQIKESNMTKIEGPYSFKGVDGLKTPVYIFKEGGEKKFIGEATVKAGDTGMTFAVRMDEEYKDIETGSFEVPMRYTYLNLPDTQKINWGYNCLTNGVHHGRPEAIWNLPLLQAHTMFPVNQLAGLVVTRIYKDAMQYVEHGVGDKNIINQKWANRIQELADKRFFSVLSQKVAELVTYYDSPQWRKEVQSTIDFFKEETLNKHYQPLHSHDSINLLCRILGTGVAIKATEELSGK
jgi:hypothetical protein